MGKNIRFIAAVLLVSSLSALVFNPAAAMFSEPFFEKLWDKIGFNSEEWAGPVLNSISVFFASETIYSIALICMGFGIGVFAHSLASRSVRNKTPALQISDEELRIIGQYCIRFSENAQAFFAQREEHAPREVNWPKTPKDKKLAGEAESYKTVTGLKFREKFGSGLEKLKIDFEKIGIKGPDLFHTTHFHLRTPIAKIGAIGEFLVDGNLDDARKIDIRI